MSYFDVLNDVAREPSPSPEDIDTVEEFLAPFDPLVSYFAHHEVALLLERSKSSSPSEELREQLHIAYYGTANDRSVTNVLRAIELLTEHAEASQSEIERWDDLHALLEILRQRWAQRQQRPRRIHYELADCEESLSRISAAFDVLDEIAARHPDEFANWPGRRGSTSRAVGGLAGNLPLAIARTQGADRKPGD